METVYLINKLEIFYLSFGVPFVFISSFIEITPMGWSIPGGLILILGGFFSYGTGLSLAEILTAGTLGSWLTFVLAYLLGIKSGDWFIKRLKQEKNAKKAKILLKKHGGVILTTSMLANLIRFWMAYVAGSQRYSILRFLFYSFIAAFAWTALFVSIGYLAGSERVNLEASISRIGIVGWLLLVLAIVIILFSIRREFKQFKEEEA